MKKGLIFATTLAMALGVGVAVGAHQKKAAEVKAATEVTIYYAVATSYTVKLNVCVEYNEWEPEKAVWQTHVMSKNGATVGGVDVYTCTYTDLWDGARTMQLQQYDGETWKSQEVPFDGSWHAATEFNGKLFDQNKKEWVAYSPDVPVTTYQVHVFVDDAERSGSPETIAKDALPAEPAAQFGKEFSGWCSDQACTTPIAGITSDTTVYGKFTPLPTVTYTINDSLVEYGSLKLYAFEEEKGNISNAEWPGVAIANKTIEVPNDAKFIINDGADQQTVDVTQSGIANDVLRIMPAEEGNNGVVWESVIPAPGEGYYVMGSANDWAYSADIKMSTEDLNPGDVAQFIGFEAKAGDEIRVASFYVDRDPYEQYANLQGGASDVGELVNNNLVFDADGTYDVYAKYDNDQFLFDVVVHPEPVDPDIPKEDGYYLISSETDWKYAGATKMVQTEDPHDVAHLYNYEPQPGEGIKVRSYFSKEDKHSACTTTEVDYGEIDEYLNFVFDDELEPGATFDIYAYYDKGAFLFSVAPHAERYQVTVVAKQFAGAQYQGETSELARDEVIEGHTYEVTAAIPSGYVALGVYSDFDCTVPFISGETVVTSDLMLHIKCMQLGYYLAGGEDSTFSVENAIKLSSTVSDKIVGAVTVPAGTDAEHPFVVKPLEYVADRGDGQPGWAPATYTAGDGKSYAFVSINAESSNFEFVEPGTYAFYVNNGNEVWFNSGEYAFHEDFLSRTAAQCDGVEGKHSNLEALQSAWVDFAEAFDELTLEEKAAIIAVGMEHGDEKSTDARLRMIARYAYIVTKYGTEMFEDFIWDQTIEPRVPLTALNSNYLFEGNSAIIIVMTIAATSALAFTLLLVFKKKKQK